MARNFSKNTKRTRKTILFSRNNVKIEREDNVVIEERFQYTMTNTVAEIIVPVQCYHHRNAVNVRKRTVRCKSPLGFYYTKNVGDGIKIYPNGRTEHQYYKLEKYVISLDNKRYTLSYPISWRDTKIGIDTRPYDLTPGFDAMPDHFLGTLVREIDKFFDVAIDNKVRVKPLTAFEFTNTKSVGELRKVVFKDMFGYEDGPKVQSNTVKILSHGFDLKESFRKAKEGA